MYTRKASRMKKILIADDEPHILDLLRLILENKYQVYTAEDGEQALSILEEIEPDLLILDVMMPKLNGYELCEKLKKNSKTAQMKIAMLSAKTQERDIMKGLKLGADFYLTKPFDPTGFERQVEEMIGDQ